MSEKLYDIIDGEGSMWSFWSSSIELAVQRFCREYSKHSENIIKKGEVDIQVMLRNPDIPSQAFKMMGVEWVEINDRDIKDVRVTVKCLKNGDVEYLTDVKE